MMLDYLFEVKSEETVLTTKSLIPINCIDGYSLKSVGKIQKIMFLIWKSDCVGMQIMLTIMYLWNLGFVLEFYRSIMDGVTLSYDHLAISVLTILMNIYIILLSAKINDFFMKQIFIYQQLKD